MPYSNQQIMPALMPPSTTPRSYAARNAASSPHSRHSASSERVLPPPT